MEKWTMLTIHVPAWEIVVRTAAVYLALLFGLRLAGKREIGQMTVFDLVVLLLIANAVQNAMVGPDTSLTGGLLAAAVLVLVNMLIAALRLRSQRVRHLVEGSPTLLVLRGHTIDQHMRREGIDLDILEAAIREHGIAGIEDVEMAVLETDGTISIVPTGGNTKRIKHPARFLKR
jgi:uncharacterized membrane protein YcaP (DUF421 family)